MHDFLSLSFGAKEKKRNSSAMLGSQGYIAKRNCHSTIMHAILSGLLMGDMVGPYLSKGCVVDLLLSC